jgi:hypothetical protein
MYRKCRLEDIKLPLITGNLRNVPMEEVKPKLLWYRRAETVAESA